MTDTIREALERIRVTIKDFGGRSEDYLAGHMDGSAAVLEQVAAALSTPAAKPSEAVRETTIEECARHIEQLMDGPITTKSVKAWLAQEVRSLAALASPQAAPGAPLDIVWKRINGEPFEYAIQQDTYGDEFVKLANGTCLRRPAPPSPRDGQEV